MFTCPGCSFETETLNEGYCKYCQEERQNALDLHNFTYDLWNKKTDAEKDVAIRNAINV